MASIIDSFQESINENLAIVKIFVFSIPVYCCIQLFLMGKMEQLTFWGIVFGLLFFGLVTLGINNVRLSKNEIFSFNPLRVGFALIKALLVVVPQALVLGFIGHFIVMTLTSIPVEIEQYPLVIAIIVWSILGSILLTSYLSFAKYLRITEGYNFKVVAESCVDVFISVLFFVPQLLLADLIIFGPIYYVFEYFKVELTHWGFIAFASVVVVINISMLTNYLAQAAYEQIKGNNEDYDNNYSKVDMIEQAAERMGK